MSGFNTSIMGAFMIKMETENKEKQRLECLNKAIARRDYIFAMIRQLKKGYEEECESVRIWSNKDD